MDGATRLPAVAPPCYQSSRKPAALSNRIPRPRMVPFNPDDSLAERIRECVIELLVDRGAGRSICPSEAARLLGMRSGSRWQDLMRPVRTVAAALVEAGVLEVTQHGIVVDIGDVRGPVRLSLRSLHGQRSISAA
jgi:Protein of unknown function (DUF3253)